MSDYGVPDVADALRAVGVRPGDVVFSHASLGPLGRPRGEFTEVNIASTVADGFRRVGATLCVPTFTYSFPRGEIFDPHHTRPDQMGAVSEYVLASLDSYRTTDPIFSVAAIGHDARRMTYAVGPECFGPDSFWERLLQSDGKIINVNMDAGSTFVHYVERRLDVAYRKDRRFDGVFRVGGRKFHGYAIYFSRDLEDPAAEARFGKLDTLARDERLVREARLGRGTVLSIDVRDMYELIRQTLPERPELLIAGEP